jgi:hypothetical protein
MHQGTTELEARIGIESLAELLHTRERLVKSVAQLRARHGPGGVFGDQRTRLLAVIKQKIRAQALLKTPEAPMSEAALDREAHASDEYATFLAQGLTEKADWVIRENEIDSITERINRGQCLARFAAAEISLTPR